MAMTRGNMRKQISKPPAKRKKPKMLKKGGDPKIPAKYLAGLSPSEKVKRKKEINRNRKKADNDPSAYQFSTDFKGGKRRKTKPSVYTTKFKKQFG
tara:strand:+ start:183 stop:470 length:288 start_codon:yes stop_codon:yes gene_type:complete